MAPEVAATREDLEAFCAMNGVFNAWPYAREFVQSSMARMNLPALVLPVMRYVPREAVMRVATSGVAAKKPGRRRKAS